MGSSATTSLRAPLLTPSIRGFRLHPDDGAPVSLGPMVDQAGYLGLRRLPPDYGPSRPNRTCCPLDPLRSDDPTGGSTFLLRPKPETCLLVARVRLPSLDGPKLLHLGRVVAFSFAATLVPHPRRVSFFYARVHETRDNESAARAMDRVGHLLDDHARVLHSCPPGSTSRSLTRAAAQHLSRLSRRVRASPSDTPGRRCEGVLPRVLEIRSFPHAVPLNRGVLAVGRKVAVRRFASGEGQRSGRVLRGPREWLGAREGVQSSASRCQVSVPRTPRRPRRNRSVDLHAASRSGSTLNGSR